MAIVWAGADYFVKSAKGGILMIRIKRLMIRIKRWYSNDKN